MTKTDIQTAIIERERELRKNLVLFINSAPGFLCTDSYSSIKDALTGFSQRLPDIVLCNLPFSDGREKKMIQALREKYPRLPILILNLYDESKDVSASVKAKTGGCLLKLTLPAGLLRNIKTTLRSEASILNQAVANIIRSFREFMPPAQSNYELTPHERRIMKLLIDGHNHTTAAEVLNVSYNTIKFHMRRIYQKLEVNSKSAAVAKVMRYRLAE
jgi:DNA-binding NarL/FixJ family response regulator